MQMECHITGRLREGKRFHLLADAPMTSANLKAIRKILDLNIQFAEEDEAEAEAQATLPACWI